MKRWIAVAVLALGCRKPDPAWKAERYCPDAPGCASGAPGRLRVGAAKRDVSPTAFEIARPELLEAKGVCAPARCGELDNQAYKDCGSDNLCPGGAGYVGPDADSSEKDGVLDFWRDCGRDRLCPGEPGYPGPDPDGTEKNRRFDGFWLAGFGSGRPMQAIHDPIWARAVVIENGDTAVALVVIDAVGIFYESEVLRIRENVSAAGVDVDYVAVAATHDHEAPDTMGQWGQGNFEVGLKRGVDEAWLEDLLTRAADAVVEAARNLREARAYFATTTTGYEGWVHDGRDPLIYDDALTTARFEDLATRETIATVVNWGSHPETLSDWHNEMTSDYPHYLREAVEKGLPAAGAKPSVAGVGGVCVFVNGALGGIIGPLPVTFTSRSGQPYNRASFEKAQAEGENVAEAALLALAAAAPWEGAKLPLSFAAQTLKLPVDNVAFQIAIDNFQVFNRKTYVEPGSDDRLIKTEIAVIVLGPAKFITTPGEIFPELVVGFADRWSHGKPRIKATNPNPPLLNQAPPAPYVKDRFPAAYQFLLGLTNDELGYFVPPYDFQLADTFPYIDEAPGDHYEETNSLGPRTVPKLLEVYERLQGFVEWQAK